MKISKNQAAVILKALKYGCVNTESSFKIEMKCDEIYTELKRKCRKYFIGEEELSFNLNLGDNDLKIILDCLRDLYELNETEFRAIEIMPSFLTIVTLLTSFNFEDETADLIYDLIIYMES